MARGCAAARGRDEPVAVARGPGSATVASSSRRREPDGGGRLSRVSRVCGLPKDAGGDYDAVVVSTPDHTHAVAATAAIDRKKHVYIEKPLARTISEVRGLTEAAAEAGITTQLGHQGHGNDGIRLTREWIQDGAIGPVTEVHAWCDGANGSCGGRPSESPPVPYGLDWDLWLGPARRVPYHSDYTPCGWRYFWEFGTSKIGDMGSHNMDPAFNALDLGHPEWVEARSAWGDRELRPFVSIVD